MRGYDEPRDWGCPMTPPGWWCSQLPDHAGPCAARPRWWNLRALWRANRLPGCGVLLFSLAVWAVIIAAVVLVSR